MRAFWLNILPDFGVTRTQPTLVCEDNLASMAMSVNPVHRKYSRHIDIRRHYIRELCLGNLVKLVPLRTNLMVADALTAWPWERHVMMGHSGFQVRLSHAIRGGKLSCLLNSAFFHRLFRMGESVYLNDNTRT